MSTMPVSSHLTGQQFHTELYRLIRSNKEGIKKMLSFLLGIGFTIINHLERRTNLISPGCNGRQPPPLLQDSVLPPERAFGTFKKEPHAHP